LIEHKTGASLVRFRYVNAQTLPRESPGANADALVDARRSARRLRRFEQALDHPVLPTLPETEYFKGLLLEMMPRR
jgi:23S rRNA G2069 N7-methylase RlmK/C1962 C5-methylase RlmI